MKTDVITVSAKGGRMEKALEQVDKVIAYKELTGKKALHLRLLAEEMMGLMRSVTGEPEGSFWIEEEDGEYTLHLCVRTFMDPEKKQKLLSVSSTGKNESARGIMGRLRDFFDRGADDDVATLNPMMTQGLFEHTSTPTLDWEWSLVQYQQNVSAAAARNDSEAREAWDELEKSVVAHVADDVKVYIRGDKVDMVIVKKMN
jgi:hypothetical protein